MEVDLLISIPSVSLHTCVFPSVKVRMAESVLMKLGIYFVELETISTAYFVNPSHKSACLCMHPLSLLVNGLVKTLPWLRACARLEQLLGE
jgi:hypothetical protein